MYDVSNHIANINVLVNGDMTTTLTTPSLNINEVSLNGIQCVWNGSSPVGVLSVNVSNDNINWTSMGTLPVSGNSGSDAFNVQLSAFCWLQVVYTPTSGSGSLNISINQKSV